MLASKMAGSYTGTAYADNSHPGSAPRLPV
jgi:hypothetical protein